MGGFFEDLEYPDNEKRGHRASELANDISTGLSLLSSQRTQIDQGLKDADAAMQEAYGKLKAGVPDIARVPVVLGDSWSIELFENLESLVTFGGVAYGIERASVSYLVAKGRLGEGSSAGQGSRPSLLDF